MKKNTTSRPKTYSVEEPMVAYSGGMIGSFLYFLGGNSVFKENTEIKGSFDFINIIRKGLSRKSLDYLMKYTGISVLEMADIIHTTDRTLRRYTPDTILNPEQSERALELARLYARGTEVFESLNTFKEWMDTPLLALGNKKPKEFLDTSIGIDILMEELGRIEQGVFA